MRANNANYSLISDQVSSTVMVVDASGNVVAQSLYYPFGEERYTSGSLPTDKTFTSQRSEDFGLLDYNARYYSAALGSFVSPDTLVPQPSNMLDWNRYDYMHGNPVRLNDPSGQKTCEGLERCDPLPKSIFTRAYYQNKLQQEYSWSVSNDFSLAEVKFLYEVAGDMRLFFSNTTGGHGESWMDNNIGDKRRRITTSYFLYNG